MGRHAAASMRKKCFFLSAIVHAFCIILISRINFPIKIALTFPSVINVALRQPESTLTETLPLPNFPGRRRHDQVQPLPPGSDSPGDNPSFIAAMSTGRLPAGGRQRGDFKFSAIGQLKLKSTSASTFSLTVPMGGPFAAPTFTATPKTAKWFLPGEYAAADYHLEIQFNESSHTDDEQPVRMPFSPHNKEATLWSQRILTRIERNWIIPTVTRIGYSGQVEITLTIDRSGELLSLSVAKSSAHETLEQAALHALKASLPFPPFPESISTKTFVFQFVFTYNA